LLFVHVVPPAQTKSKWMAAFGNSAAKVCNLDEVVQTTQHDHVSSNND